MDYWKGFMNWPVDNDWQCSTCKGGSWYLEWGFVHAHCRCARCHTEFFMRDENKEVVDVPICMLKSEYREPARFGYALYRKPISEFTGEEWEYVLRACNENPDPLTIIAKV